MKLDEGVADVRKSVTSNVDTNPSSWLVTSRNRVRVCPARDERSALSVLSRGEFNDIPMVTGPGGPERVGQGARAVDLQECGRLDTRKCRWFLRELGEAPESSLPLEQSGRPVSGRTLQSTMAGDEELTASAAKERSGRPISLSGLELLQ